MIDLRSLAGDIRKARTEAEGDRYGGRVEAFGEAVGLDESVLSRMKDHDLSDGLQPVSLSREPVRQGMGSYWLCRLDIVMEDGSTLRLMEKAVEAGGPEAKFWRRAGDFHMSGRRFASIGPLFSIETEPITILYLPYRDGVHQSKVESKRNFRANIDDLVRAVAEFNASNVTKDDPAEARRIVSTRKDAPSIRDICNGLGLPSRHAARLLRNACLNIDARWKELEERYDALPVSLCHNDIGPGNAIVTDGNTHLLDFEKAGLAPVGSDMHTIVRWGGKCLEDGTEAERLLQLYSDEFRAIRPEVTDEQLRVGAWVTFFIRYSSIAKWRSARNLDSFTLALLKAAELLDAAPR